MHYYDFAYLLELLNIPFEDSKCPNDEEEAKAREAIQELNDASAGIVRKWLEEGMGLWEFEVGFLYKIKNPLLLGRGWGIEFSIYTILTREFSTSWKNVEI